MAAYVPADALLYMEANSVPQIISGLIDSHGWSVLAGPAGIKTGLLNAGWFSRLATWIGIGSADTIVFSRMQVAAVVLGVAAADGGDTLNVKPRIALVVETHASESRTLASIEKNIGNFARRAYADAIVEKREVDGAHWIVWSSVSSERRIIAVVAGSVAIIGNHETAIQACLAVQRGQRPSLAGNIEIEGARRRVSTGDALAFGYMSSQGAASLFELAAAVYMGQASENAMAQGIAANLLPEMAKKIIGNVTWSSRLVNGAIEDDYFISTTNDAGARLRAALAPTTANNLPVAELLPLDTYSVTRYSTRDPLMAWRGLSFSVSSQMDPVVAVMVPPFLKATLAPYGIDDPDLFLQSIGPNIVTSRTENLGNRTVLIVEVRDERALHEFVLKRLGTTKPQVEKVGDIEILWSEDQKRGAASFLSGYLLLGPRDSIRRCLDARGQKRDLSVSNSFQSSLTNVAQDAPTHVVTFTRDSAPAQKFIVFLANLRAARGQPANTQELELAIGQLPYAVSEMRFVEGGIERKTKSTFGLLGAITTQFATKE